MTLKKYMMMHSRALVIIKEKRKTAGLKNWQQNTK
jgi:hypothetical protein